MSKLDVTRRSVLKTGSVAGAGLALPTIFTASSVAAYTNEPTGGTVTLGFNVPQTGPYADEGNDELLAQQLAVDHLNGIGDGGCLKIGNATPEINLPVQVEAEVVVIGAHALELGTAESLRTRRRSIETELRVEIGSGDSRALFGGTNAGRAGGEVIVFSSRLTSESFQARTAKAVDPTSRGAGRDSDLRRGPVFGDVAAKGSGELADATSAETFA